MPSKKVIKRNRMIATLISLALGVAVICLLLFAPMVKMTAKLGNSTSDFSGIDVMFGATQNTGISSFKILNFNFLAFLTLIFAGLATLTSLVRFKSFWMRLLPVVLYGLSALFMFLMLSFFHIAIEGGKDAYNLIKFGANLGLGWGAIVGGIVALLAALFSAVRAFKKL